MSDKKPPRSTNDIKQEYTNLCLRAGNLQYELECKKTDLNTLNEQLRQLNSEYISASNTEAEAAKEAAPAPEAPRKE